LFPNRAKTNKLV